LPDQGWNVAALLGDHTVLEKAGIGAPAYVGDAVRRGIEEMKKRGDAEVYISHFRPSLIFLEEMPADHWHPDERGKLVATVELCGATPSTMWTGQQGRSGARRTRDKKWAVGIVRWDDGSWRISGFNDVPTPCFYDQQKGDRVPVRP
jgi:hypothetical protein